MKVEVKMLKTSACENGVLLADKTYPGIPLDFARELEKDQACRILTKLPQQNGQPLPAGSGKPRGRPPRNP